MTGDPVEARVTAAPVVVGRAEGELLSVARALVTPGAYASIEATLASGRAIDTLGPTAMRVLQSTLAKGAVKMLARLGGARTRRGVRPMLARPAPALPFGPYTFELVRWLACARVGAPDTPSFEHAPKTAGDELVAHLALRLVEGEPLARGVFSQPGLRASALGWLGHAASLARWAPEDVEAPLPPIGRLVDDAPVILECLSDDLRRCWIAASTSPPTVAAPVHALRVALAEQRTLATFLDAVRDRGRWDLATFLVEAGARVLPRGAAAKDVAARAVPVTREKGSLRARTEARKNAGALFHALVRLGKKHEELSLVRFFEDGYDEAQAVLAAWEMLGKDGFLRAEEVVRELAALPEAGAEAEPSPPRT